MRRASAALPDRARTVVAATTAMLSLLGGADPAQAKVTGAEASDWRPDVARADRYADTRSGEVAIAVVDMRGRLREDRGRLTMPMASTFKVMLLVAYLRHEAHHRDLDRWERRLLVPMIRVSDNVAATRIRDILGPGPISKLAGEAGMHDFSYDQIWGLSRTSAIDQARLMRRLEQLVPPRHWPFARRQLASIVPAQRWGIGEIWLPRGWRLRFKGGWGSGSGAVDHQVVLVENGRWRVGLAVMTQGSPDHPYATDTLRGVFARLLHELPG